MSIVWIVAKREFLDIVRTRGYWFTVILLPLMIAAAPIIGLSSAAPDYSIDPTVIADMFQNIGVEFAPMLFFITVFTILMQGAQYLINNTVEEKSNRIVEMLISSITPDELMRGKLLGIGLASFLSMVVLLLSFYLFMFAVTSFLTDGAFEILSVIISGIIRSELLPWLLFYSVSAYGLLSGIFLAAGALCNNNKEAQGLMLPLIFLMVLPMFVLPLLDQEILVGVTRILSWVPLFTPFLMLGRMIVGEVSTIELIGTSVLLIASIYLMLWLSARVFRFGILRIGQPLKFREIIRSIRASTG